MPSRELTQEERAAIRKLVTRQCANYCGTYKLCLPLDEPCYMLGKVWTGAYCKYFREAVLPLAPALDAALTGDSFRRCVLCGQPIQRQGRAKYCPPCAKAARRGQQRGYTRKWRGTV